jgi:hypothetical protein
VSSDPKPVLAMWTIYDHPTDYPNHFVARKYIIAQGTRDPIGTKEVRLEAHLYVLREHFAGLGLMCVPRWEEDDTKIVETWM